jgi:diguanylate cyclase (GGDEF)-like protein
MAARYGGEEFICVLPVSDAEHAGQIAEVIRSSVEALGIHHETSEVSDHVTVSIGVASVVPLPNSFPQSLIKEADSALYQAKNKGRNNVRVLA